MKKVAILCDFDGTVAQNDVGNRLFQTFGEPEACTDIVRQWKDGKISSRECLEGEAAFARVDADQLNAWIAECPLDPYFKDFYDFARKRGMEMAILSDGLDYYIRRMLYRDGLGDIEFYSNHLEIKGDRFEVTFPHYDLLSCTDCGCCKTHHLMRFRTGGYYVVYVGDGMSDRCPSESADLVFAKGDLARHCRTRGINYVSFDNFRDVEREVLQRIVLSGDFEMGNESA